MHPGTPSEQSIPLELGATSIGRTTDNDIVVSDGRMSRQHAIVEIRLDGAFVADAGSRNGTWLNGTRIDRAELRPGDLVGLGDVLFRFVVDLPMGGVTPEAVRAIDPTDPEKTALSLFDIRRSVDEERNERRLQILLAVSRILSSPAGITDQLRRIVDLLAEIVGAERAAVLLLDPETRALTAAATSPESALGTGEDAFSRTICEWVRDQRLAALFSDASGDARVADAHSVRLNSIRAAMCAPMVAREELLGVLYVDHRAMADRFTPEDLDFMNAFAAQAAIAIANARLYDELRRETRMRSNLERFFPPSTVQAVQRSQDVRLVATETVVTALFADITAFTEISGRLPPLEVVQLLNDFFPVMAEIVFRHEGTLEKYIGDAMLAVWGAPFRHSDDADRAVSAAIEMQQAMAGLDARWSPRLGRRLSLHAGLCTGTVAAGNIGSAQYIQYATIGDTTNTASRISGVAGEGEVVISESTRAALRLPVPLTQLPPTTVKGKAEPLTLFRVGTGDLSSPHRRTY